MFKLEEERRRRCWSQAELGRRAGIHPMVISNLERKRVHLWPGWRRKLAQVLEIPENELLKEVEGCGRGQATEPR